MRLLYASLSFLLILQTTACGGGGGGSGGRTRDTAIKIMHGAISSAPVSVRGVGEDGVAQVLQTATYAEYTDYIRIKTGPQTINVERANAPEVVYATFAQDFKKETEYSVFAYPNRVNGTLSFKVLEDPVVQPAKGLARIRFMNASDGQASVSMSSPGLVLPPLELGSVSTFVEVPSGPRRVEFRGPSRNILAVKDVVLAEGGEMSLLISGSTKYDTFFVTSYNDMD